MNRFRKRLGACIYITIQTNKLDMFKSLTVPINHVSNRFSSRDAADETLKDNDIYVPRRIKRRMKEKNLNIEEFEITPVYSDKQHVNKKPIEKTLTDSIVDSHMNTEFPSDMEMNEEILKDISAKVQDELKRSKVNPRDTSVLLFPGQGSQVVGMGKKLLRYPGVKELYKKASDILGYDLLNLCLNGPKSDLDKTVHCQPALYVTSLAAVERLKEDYPQAHERCTTAAGFSLGEITALAYSGAMSFEDGLKLVKVRAQAMQKASEAVPSGMMSVFSDHRTNLGEALQTAKEYCISKHGIEKPYCQVANYLCTEVKVVAGNEEALQFLEKYGKEFGIRGTKRLPVSGAFHTPLMLEDDSLRKMRKVLQDIEIKTPPSVRVYSNTTGQRYANPEHIRRLLTTQFCKVVKWEQIIQSIYRRMPGLEFPNTYEVGPKRELGTLLKRTNLKAYTYYKHIEV